MSDTVKRKTWICIGLIVLLLVIDQVVKIWIKTTLPIGGEIRLIGDWCKLHFVENEGIAFGISFGASLGKLFLSLFRLIASGVIVFILVRQLKKDAPYTLLLSITLILIGAVGNLIDCCFYGLVFNESGYDQVATMFPDGGGYAGFLFGRVVDMFYFPMFHWTWPDWVPMVGGQNAEFFNAIFNVADACVCVGVALLIIDQLFLHPEKKDEENASETAPNSENSTSAETI